MNVKVINPFGSSLNISAAARRQQLTSASKLSTLPRAMLADALVGARVGRDACRVITRPLVGPVIGEPKQQTQSLYNDFCNGGGSVAVVIGVVSTVAVETTSLVAAPFAALAGAVAPRTMNRYTAPVLADLQNKGTDTTWMARLSATAAGGGRCAAAALGAMFCGSRLYGQTLGIVMLGVLAGVYGVGKVLGNVVQTVGAVLGAVTGALVGLGDGLYNLGFKPHTLVPADSAAF